MLEPQAMLPATELNLPSYASIEKKCNKCGFATFSLRVLYIHRQKCKGKLLRTLSCCYCSRKFSVLSSYVQHKRSCVKCFKKKKILQKRLLKVKLEREKKKKQSLPQKAWVCNACSKAFPSRLEFKSHLEKGACNRHYKKKKRTYSARKSFSKNSSRIKETNKMDLAPEKSGEEEDPCIITKDFVCMWCKSKYPAKKLLLKHFEKNVLCANYFFQQKKKSSLTALTARKTIQVVAIKSFSGSKHKHNFLASSPIFNGSARKSLSNSSKRKSSLNLPQDQNQCPVCFIKFRDAFNFFQHQKKFNHWGTAVKSANSIIKCPFCDKQFFHVRARNIHVRNHADKSEGDIEYFLRKTTCSVCSQIFASESAKYQHMRIDHPKVEAHGNSSKENDSKRSLLPLVIKQKLKFYPNTCPICSKEFPTTFFRDKHFQGKHLDSELECKFCSLKYTSVDSLEYHMQDSHYNSFKFECLVCKINLATAPHVVLHVTKVHPDKDPKIIIRSRESALMNRDRQFDDQDKNEFYCDVCEITFLKKCGLQSHRQSKFHKDMLIKSLDAMHEAVSNLPSPPRLPKKPPQKPEILTCNECLEDFATVKDFVPHRLSHFSKGKYLKINDLNMYTCEICGEVSNSHSKVQMHLFWHLQVESTSIEKDVVKDQKQLVSDRLSNQSIAKKSFGKSADSPNEVIIGGIKKPLFTCEDCSIGFTTQAHFSLHTRKFCKVKNALKAASGELDETSISSANSTRSRKDVFKTTNIKYCAVCKCLFKLQIGKVHERFCSNSTPVSSGNVLSVKKLKAEMESQNSVAACIICSQQFNDPRVFSKHMLHHCESKENSVSNENKATNHFENIVLCTSCNCLFLTSSTQTNHEAFCKNSSYHTFDAEDSKDIIKPALEVEGATAVCIKCCLAFIDCQTLKEHINQHGSDSDLKNDPKSNDTSANSYTNDSSPSVPPDSAETSSEPNLSFSGSLSKDSSQQQNEEQNASLDENDPVTILRENFSKLLCILISDSELMTQLGYGVQPIDEVLVNVLKQMGQTPVLKDDELSVIEYLRKNIKILMDFCLKEQIMEMIGGGKGSVDEIVIEALGMFSSEETKETSAVD